MKKGVFQVAGLLAAAMLLSGVPALTAHAEVSADGWDQPPATWTIQGDTATNTNAAFLNNYLTRSDENALGDYTVSATFHGTDVATVDKEVDIGVIPWYRDAQNYVVIYLQWRDFGTHLGNIEILYFKDGVQHGKEGEAGWNDHWHDGFGYTDTIYTLTPANEITLTAEKTYDAARGLDVYAVTVEGTNDAGNKVTAKINSDAYSVSVPYAAFPAKVGLYSMNNTVTFSDVSVAPAENSKNYLPVAGTDAVARTDGTGWTYEQESYHVDASAGADAASTQALLPNPNAENNYAFSFTAAFEGDGVLSVLPYYADESNFVRFTVSKKEGGADITAEGKADNVSFREALTPFTGTLDWAALAVRTEKTGGTVSLYFGETLAAQYSTRFTDGGRVGFGGKGNITFTDASTAAVEYRPYDWFGKDGYTVSAKSTDSVTFSGDTVNMAADETDGRAARFYAAAAGYYDRISLSATFTATDNAANTEYGLYLLYLDDENYVSVGVTAEGVTLTACVSGEATMYSAARSLDLSAAHSLSAEREFSAVSVTLDGEAVQWESGEANIALLSATENGNVGAYAKNGTVRLDGYTVAGFIPYEGVTEAEWNFHGARLDSWSISGDVLTNTLDGGTDFTAVNALRASDVADPASGYFVSAEIRVLEQANGEWKYGIIPYYKDANNCVFIWLSQWAGQPTTVCMYALMNGVPAFSSSPNGFLEAAIDFVMKDANALEVQVSPDGSIEVYLNRSRTPTVSTRIEALEGAEKGMYGVNAFNVSATFSGVQATAERLYSVRNQVVIHFPASFPTGGTVGKAVNLGVITATLVGDGGIPPTPVVTVTGPDGEPVQLSGMRFTPQTAGTYTVTAVATDSWGNTATETRTIEITDGTATPSEPSNGQAGESQGLSGGAIAGIAVGSAVGAGGIGVGLYFLIRWLKKRRLG